MKLINFRHSSFLNRRDFAEDISFANFVRKKGERENGTMARNRVSGDK